MINSNLRIILDWCNSNKFDKTNYIVIQTHHNKFNFIKVIEMNHVILLQVL